MNTMETFAALSGKLYMGGTYQPSQATDHFDVIEPATEERIGQIADATDAEVDAATDVAIAAGRVWNAIDMRSRAVVMHEIAAVMRRDKALYAEYLTREEGKPFKESLDEVSWCATAMDYYAEIARHEAGRIAGATVPGQFHFAMAGSLRHGDGWLSGWECRYVASSEPACLLEAGPQGLQVLVLQVPAKAAEYLAHRAHES